MKTTIKKNLATFILLMGGMFSFTFANAQCVCYCAPQPKNQAECFTKSNGTQGCRHTNCRYRIGSATTTPYETSLTDVYPNPVSGTTMVSFYVGQTMNVSLKVYDISGRIVTALADASFNEGDYEIIWNAADVNAGIYFLRIETAVYSENLKLIVQK